MKKEIKKALIISTATMFVVSSVIYVVQQKELSVKYAAAVEYAQAGDYINAKNVISTIGEYKNSEALLVEYGNEIDYQKAQEFVAQEEYDQALKIYERLNAEGAGYKDSADLQDNIEYTRAIKLAEAGSLSEAYEGFKRLPTTYMDASERIRELSYALKFVDKWYCKEHQIDLELTATVSRDNIVYIDAVMSDRNGFLLDAEDNKLTGNDLVLMEDRFVWNLLGGETKYAVIMDSNKLKIAKQPVADNKAIVTFVRKLENYNPIDGDINAALNSDIDGGL